MDLPVLGEDGPHCTLSPAALEQRLQDWRAVMERALRSEQARDGVTVADYPHEPALRARIDTLIAAEGECCAFLRFDIEERDEFLRLTLHHPPEFNLLAVR